MNIYEPKINIGRLRDDLTEHFGTAAGYMPFAYADIVSAENASKEELIEMAADNGFDIEDYLE